MRPAGNAGCHLPPSLGDEVMEVSRGEGRTFWNLEGLAQTHISAPYLEASTPHVSLSIRMTTTQGHPDRLSMELSLLESLPQLQVFGPLLIQPAPLAAVNHLSL